MTGLDLATAILATWRLAHLIAREDGPGDVFRRWRIAVGGAQTLDGRWVAPTAWGRLWLCPLCLSVWIGGAVLAVHRRVPAARLVIQMLAVSGGASLLSLWNQE